MKRIINYIQIYYNGLNAIWSLFNIVTTPFLLHLDADVYKNIYLIWFVLQIPFIIVNLVEFFYRTKN